MFLRSFSQPSGGSLRVYESASLLPHRPPSYIYCPGAPHPVSYSRLIPMAGTVGDLFSQLSLSDFKDFDALTPRSKHAYPPDLMFLFPLCLTV